MKKKRIIIGSVVAAVLVGALTVAAVVSPDARIMQLLKGALTPSQMGLLMDFRAAHQADRQQRMAEHPDPVQVWRDLALTETQQTQLLDVAAMNVDEISFAAQKTQASAAALRRAVFAGPPNNPAIQAASVQLGRDLGDTAVLAAQALDDARTILTPAQVKLLQDLEAKHDQRLDQALTDMPARVDELVTLWNNLALTPGQVDALSRIHDAIPGIMRDRHKNGRQEFRAELAGILTPAQLKLVDKFHAQARAGKPGRGMEGRKQFEAELALSGGQKIALVNLVIARRESLQTAAALLAAAGMDLRDQVLAAPVNEAALRQAADRLAEVIGDCASLGAQMVADARKIVSARQFAVIEKAAAARDLKINQHLGQAPIWVHRLIGFLDQLNLTPDQKKAIADLIEKRHAERRARFAQMHRAF